MTEQEKAEEMHQLSWRQVLRFMRLLDEDNKRKREVMSQALKILEDDRNKWDRMPSDVFDENQVRELDDAIYFLKKWVS